MRTNLYLKQTVHMLFLFGDILGRYDNHIFRTDVFDESLSSLIPLSKWVTLPCAKPYINFCNDKTGTIRKSNRHITHQDPRVFFQVF